MKPSSLAPDAPRDVIFFDGDCALCNGFVRFVVKRDRHARFGFAALQEPLAAEVLPPLGHQPARCETVVLVRGLGRPGAEVAVESDAVAGVLLGLGGVWRWLGHVMRLVPRPLRNFGYRRVARNRQRLFGRMSHCPVPAPELRSRFLDQPASAGAISQSEP